MTLTVYTFIYIGVVVADGDTCFLDSRMAINVVAYRLRRMELNKCKLNHSFCSITKQ